MENKVAISIVGVGLLLGPSCWAQQGKADGGAKDHGNTGSLFGPSGKDKGDSVPAIIGNKQLHEITDGDDRAFRPRPAPSPSPSPSPAPPPKPQADVTPHKNHQGPHA